MNQNDYRSAYAALELPMGAPWREIRRAYRATIKKWHPDRITDPAAGVIAVERTKTINAAYRELERYYRTHGHVPTMSSPVAVTKQNEPPASPASKPDPRYVEPPLTNPEPSVSPHKFRWVVLVLVSVGTVVLLTRLKSDLSWQEAHGPAKIEQLKARYDRPRRNDTAVPAAVAYFTAGSAPAEVYAAQGKPTRIEGNVWYYGESSVHFEGGVVAHWTTHPDTPLQATLSAHDPTGASRLAFRYGSTRDEVRRIQGVPTSESLSEWRYGDSRIFFDGDRVSGWEELPNFPLRAERRFGRGSSKNEVRAVQGEPWQQSTNEWRYGESRVFFRNDVVIDWNESPYYPLHIRR